MNKKDIEATVLNIIQDKIDEKRYIARNAVLLDEGIDSLKIIEVVVKIEEIFNFEFEDEKLSYETLRSINSIAEYVYQRIEEKQ